MGMLLCSTVALSACSAGQVNQTSSQLRDKTGPEGAVGELLLREVELAYPQNGAYAAGDDAELRAAIVNTGTQPDTLVNVTGPGFTSVRVTGSDTGSAAVATSTPTPGATPTQPSTPATGAARQIVIQPGETVFLGENSPTVTLVGVNRPLTPASAVPVTFTFQTAGQVTIEALVATPSRALPRGEAFRFEGTNEGDIPGNEGGGGGIPTQREGGE